jgi:hypothetical protein
MPAQFLLNRFIFGVVFCNIFWEMNKEKFIKADEDASKLETETYGDQMKKLIKIRREKYKKRAGHKGPSAGGILRKQKRMRGCMGDVSDHSSVHISNLWKEAKGFYWHFNNIKNAEDYGNFDSIKMESKEDWEELDKHNAFILMQRDLELFTHSVKPVPGILEEIKSYKLNHSSASSSSEEEDQFFVERARECIEQNQPEIENKVKTFWRTKERYVDACKIKSSIEKKDVESLKLFKSKFNE